MIIAVHGSPGFPEDFNLLFEKTELAQCKRLAIHSTEDALKTALLASTPSKTTLIAYSWGAYLALKTLLGNPSLQPAHLILVAPYLAPSDTLSHAAKALIQTPLISDLLITLSKGKWQHGLQERMFHSKDLDSARDHLSRLGSSKVWKQVLSRKVLQQTEPLNRAAAPKSQVHVIYGDKDRITDHAATENLLRSLGLAHSSHVIPGGEHGLLWTHSSVLAAEICRILDASSSEKGIPQ